MQFDHVLRLGILEDDEFQVAIYQLLFSPTQYRYEFFGTVASFLEAIEREKFDLRPLHGRNGARQEKMI